MSQLLEIVRAGCGNFVVMLVLFFLLWWLFAPTALWLLKVVLETLSSI